MNRLSIDTKLVLIVGVTFLIAYIFTFPMGWLVSDVYSYLNQGIAISNGERILTYSDAISGDLMAYKGTKYPLANAFWIGFWSKLCGLKYVYLGSLFGVLLSVFLIYKILAKESYFRLAILLVFVYPSLAFFSNSLMSCIPSFLLVSAFLYYLFRREETGKKWLILSFLAALSFWIRETNLVLLGSICLIHFIQDRRWFAYYAGGATLGFLPRIISSSYYYGDPIYYVLAESFSIQNFINNVGVYAILLLCFMPFGLFFIGKFQGKYFVPLIISSTLFILMYAFYSFNATVYSGFEKGIILMGRFMVPILPIFVLAVGWHFRKKSLHKSLKIIAAVLVCIAVIGMQLFVYKEAKLHKNISNHIYSKYADKMVLYDLSRTTNIIRYINPFHGDLSYFSDISNLENEEFMNKLFDEYNEAYLIQTINSVHADKVKYTSKIDGLIKTANRKYNVTEVENIKIKPLLYLQVVRIGEI